MKETVKSENVSTHTLILIIHSANVNAGPCVPVLVLGPEDTIVSETSSKVQDLI